MQQSKTLIGTAEIKYDEEGNLKRAQFTPAIHPMAVDRIDQELLKADKAKTADDAKRHAEVVLAEWYGWLWDIEMTDREEGKIEGEVKECETWTDGTPKMCRIELYLIKF